MTRAEIEDEITYWESRKYMAMQAMEEADDEISALLRQTPEEEYEEE